MLIFQIFIWKKVNYFIQDYLSKGLNLPFIKRTLFVEKRQKAFKYLIHELGYTQQIAQRLIAKGRLLINGEAMSKTTQEI